MPKAEDRIIVALDVPSREQAEEAIQELSPHVSHFKIGLELITSIGAKSAINLVNSHRGKVFFDGKFSDIPATVAAASREVVGLGAWMFNVHANCGLESIRAAVQQKRESLCIAVTVLTSIGKAECEEIYQREPLEQVIQFAKLAKRAGADGIVCSPLELTRLNEDPETRSLVKVVPGVRPSWAAANDQKRVLTPAEAIHAGADYLVIGRPILAPPANIGGRVKAVERILEEIEGVSK